MSNVVRLFDKCKILHDVSIPINQQSSLMIVETKRREILFFFQTMEVQVTYELPQ